MSDLPPEDQPPVEDPEALLEAMQTFMGTLAHSTPMGGLAGIGAEMWRSLVAAGMPGHYAAIWSAQWVVSSSTSGSSD